MKLSTHCSSSIVHFYGWFQQGGKYTIVLEYAELGSLIEYWKGDHEPTQQEDINMIWTSFSELFKGLTVIHSNIPPAQGRESMKMFGMHLDIKPGNILVFKRPASSNEYDVKFKIADFGLSRTKPIVSGQPDPIDRDPGGSRMYIFPFMWDGPLTSGDGMRIQRDGIMGGWRKPDSACFHDGEGPLPLIKAYHNSDLLDAYRIGDSKSFQAGKMVVRDMLIKEPAGRQTAQQLYIKAKNLEEEYTYLEVTTMRKVSRSDPHSSTYQRPGASHRRGSSQETGEPFDSPSRNSLGTEGGSPPTPASGHTYYQDKLPHGGISTLTYRPLSQTEPDISPIINQSHPSNPICPPPRPPQPQPELMRSLLSIHEVSM
ncbi:hypothetical protein PG994_000516 [Apiospora phragmitis]|uniref:non-specific serine/threonine protein kinase n=1 Tax=Apiospora phragmitis TaxID=2905665 RepID=A0ABR1X6E0_9PEZI